MKSNPIFRLFSALWRGIDGIRKVLHLVLLLVIFLFFVGAMSATAPVLPNEAALFIQPAGTLVEELEGDPYDRAIAELFDEARPQTRVRDIVDALAYAKTDGRIKAVHLELSVLGGASLPKLRRVASALEDFREAGKPVIATADFMSQASYYLAAHADKVYMHPEGLMLLQGFGRFQNYFKDAIDKLKLDWNVFRVGTHKSFVEPYTRMGMSDEDRERTGQLIEELWAVYKQDVQSARGLEAGVIEDYTANYLQRIEEADGDLAVAAVQQGLVDDLLTHVDVKDLMIGYVGEKDGSYKAVGMREYLQPMRLLDSDRVKEQNVAVIVASGDILFGDQPPGTIGAESTSRLLRKAADDESVMAVVLQIDSPGGSAFASDVIANEIEALQVAGKPVIAAMSGAAASGGYWIAVGADRIFASPATITGSIGIFGMFPTYQRTAEYLGIATDGVGSTIWAGQFRPDVEMSDNARALFQTVINDGYDDFISRVADYRGMDKAEVDAVAQGKVWTGREALELGLVDELGSLDEAVAAAAEYADLADGSFGVKLIEPELTSTEQLIVDLLGAGAKIGLDASAFRPEPSALARIAGEIEQLVMPLTRFNDPKGLYSHCFCEIE